MRIISLNICGGKIYKSLLDFIKDQSGTTDIFCFQEVFKTSSDVLVSSGFRTNIFNEVGSILKNFNGYFSESFDGYDMVKLVNFDLHLGLAIFVRKKITVSSYRKEIIHLAEGNVIRKEDYYETSRSIQSI